MLFLTVTGARSTEAAYVVAHHKKSAEIIKGKQEARKNKTERIAKFTMKAEHTKTHSDYVWFLYGGCSFSSVFLMVLEDLAGQKIVKRAFDDYRGSVLLALESSLYYHLKQVYSSACKVLHPLSVVGKAAICGVCTAYTARAIRCYFGTLYVQHVVEMAILGK